MQQYQSNLHSYGIRGLVRTCLTFLGLFPLIGLVALIDIQIENAATHLASKLIPTIGLIGVLVLLFVGWLAILNMFPAVQTSARGLRIRFFWFWWLFLAWEDITGFYRGQTGSRRIVIVVAKGLPLFQQVYGITFAEVRQPAFLISASISGYDELIRTIADRTGKQLST